MEESVLSTIKPRKKSEVKTVATANYVKGDFVMLGLWSALLSFTYFASQATSFFLIPLWIYIGLCLLGLLLPRPKEGLHKIPSKETTKWFITFQFGRLWSYPPFKHVIFSSVILRTLFLRCCGAKVSMSIGWSTHSILSDPSFVEVGKGVIIGIESLISAHTIMQGRLYLKKIKIKDGVLIGARCGISAGAEILENSVLEGGVEVLPNVVVPKGAYIGKKSTLSRGMSLQEDMVYPDFHR